MMTVAEIASVTGFHEVTIRSRIRLGISLDAMAPQGRAPKLYEFRGRWLTIRAIAAFLGVCEATVYNRRIGDRIAEDEERQDPHREPPPQSVLLTFRGERHGIAEWARRTGINRRTIMTRLRKGSAIERALTEPPRLVGSNSGIRRNRRIVQRITETVRRERNAEIIARMLNGLQHDDETGGRSKTSRQTRRTGAVPSKFHCEGAVR